MAEPQERHRARFRWVLPLHPRGLARADFRSRFELGPLDSGADAKLVKLAAKLLGEATSRTRFRSTVLTPLRATGVVKNEQLAAALQAPR